MGNQIPESSRTAVKVRDHWRCLRCGCPAPHGQWHHRRSRSVVDDHRHCTCNGIWLCPTCHRWVHAYPTEAMGGGFIVSRWEKQPGTVPVTTPFGERTNDCQGGFISR